MINVVDGVPLYLGDVARVIDGPGESTSYTWIGFGPASDRQQLNHDIYPAVAILITKKRCQCRLGETGPEYRIEVVSGLTAGETVLIASQ